MSKIELKSDSTAYRITLNDPPLHILDIEMLSQLRDLLGKVKNDRHLLIISSTGEKAFSAGASVEDHLGDRVEQMLSVFHDCFRILARLESVSVALVRGAALGGGCELALACDFILASERAKFGQPEIKLGVFPPVAAYQLSRLLSPRRGLELMLTGDSMSAESALSMGMINAVFPEEHFQVQAEQWLSRLTAHSGTSLRFAKLAFRQAQADDFEARLATVEKLYLERLMKSRDSVEGLTAFIEKRAPRWSHV